MAAIGFDTQRASQDLKAAGFNEAQAGAFQDGMIATRSDIDKLRASTKADVDKLRTSTTAEFAAVRAEMDKLRVSTTADIANLKAEVFRARESSASIWPSVDCCLPLSHSWISPLRRYNPVR